MLRGEVEIPTLGHELKRLVEERPERKLEMCGVCPREGLASVELLQHEEPAALDLLAMLFEQAVEKRGHVDRNAFGRRQGRKLREAVEGGLDPPHIGAHALCETTAELGVGKPLRQEVGEGSDRDQGVAQLVGEGTEKAAREAPGPAPAPGRGRPAPAPLRPPRAPAAPGRPGARALLRAFLLLLFGRPSRRHGVAVKAHARGGNRIRRIAGQGAEHDGLELAQVSRPRVLAQRLRLPLR